LFYFIHLVSQDSTGVQAAVVPVNKKMLASAIVTESIAYTGSMAYLQYVWYKDAERVPFHFYNDNKGYLQIDKFGHAFGAYLESEIAYKWLRKAGVSKHKALLYGGSLGIILQAPIEYFDGIYRGWGFSWGDIIANTCGSLFLISQELLFDRQLIHFKFSFLPSSYAKETNGLLGDNFVDNIFYDYNGHTYWATVSMTTILPSKSLPSWMAFSFGYSADGMLGEFENKTTWKGESLPVLDRSRQFIFSLDIDWTKIQTDKVFLKKMFSVLNHIKLPFPAVEYNSNHGFLFHWLYF
jgi:hypothetical protein